MADTPRPDMPQQADAPARSHRRAWLRRGAAGTALVAALALGLGWGQRIGIADALIQRQLAGLHLPARYRLVALGPTRAVLADVAVGDPGRPDFTAARVEVEAGLAGITAVRLVSPRLRGVWHGGRLDMGSLNRLFEGPSKSPGLPDLMVALVDARASIGGDAGPVGLALSGAGGLKDGFRGRLALSAPHLALAGCSTHARLSGSVAVEGGRPGLNGPLDLGSLACRGLTVASARIGLAARAAPTLDGGEAELMVSTGELTGHAINARRLSGPVKLALGQGRANAVWNLAAEDIRAPGAQAARLGLEGRLRAPAGFARVDGEGLVSGTGLAPDARSMGQLAAARHQAGATLAAPLLARIEQTLRREAPGSVLDGHFTFHAGGGVGSEDRFSMVVPEARLRGASKNLLLRADRLTVVAGSDGTPRFSGSFSSSTPGLPHIEGQIERNGTALRLAMDDFSAGEAHLAVPDLLLTHGAQGWRWAGMAALSGSLAQGVRVRELTLPLDGSLGAGGLALWPGCAPLHATRIEAAGLTLEGPRAQICPEGGAVLRQGPGGWRVAGRSGGLDLAGRLGDSALRLVSEGATLTGSDLSARGLAVTLGQGADASRFRLGAVTGSLGGVPQGRFTGLEAALAAVPADVQEANGAWRYADGALLLDGVALKLVDRVKPARFAPLVAEGAALSLKDGAVTTRATLREPTSGRTVVALAIAHDLAGAKGHADLLVDGLTFDKKLQPDRLSALVQGTIANAEGRIDGKGRIEWSPGHLASRAVVSSPGVDFASMAGPVRGLAGTVEFTDLLGLVTAPHQVLTIASINPGIEVTQGKLRFAIEPGHVFALEGADWPFLDGEMHMLPTRLQLGGAAVRRFEVRVAGVNAAKLITQLDLSNLAATGTFDGGLPLVFDQNGGRVVGGELVSRPPGGTVSYVGQLSYHDLSPMANYAFRALRSLRFTEMRVGMDGDIAGEVVTRVSMKGLSQGKEAWRNFITRQIGRLPLEFNVNIRAPFYQMIGSLRSLYDTSYIGDPREKGLIAPTSAAPPAAAAPVSGPKTPLSKPPIQTSVSEPRP